MNLSNNIEEAKLELQIAPLIDVVFLLLIYFMVTASLIKKEGDVAFMLPAAPSDSQVVELPVEVIIQVDEDGVVEVEGQRFSKDDRELEHLITHIEGSKQIAINQNSRFFVNILPNKNAVHSRIIDVMDACAAAKVKSLSFSKATDF
jgi:biopolymer transport protein ExbD